MPTSLKVRRQGACLMVSANWQINSELPHDRRQKCEYLCDGGCFLTFASRDSPEMPARTSRSTNCYGTLKMQQADYPLPDPLVTVSPDWLGGEPCFTGRRVPIKTLFDYLKSDHSLDEFLED